MPRETGIGVDEAVEPKGMVLGIKSNPSIVKRSCRIPDQSATTIRTHKPALIEKDFNEAFFDGEMHA